MRDRLLVAGRLREKRTELGLTRPELARLTDVSPSYIKYLEAGTGQPSDLYMRALADGLGCDVEDLTEPKPEPKASAA